MSATSTFDLDELVYGICPETGVRIVHDARTGIWGAGPTGLDALRDYDQAVIDHHEVEPRGDIPNG